MNPLEWINRKLADFLGLPGRFDVMYEGIRQIFEAEARYRAARGVFVQSVRERSALEAMAELDRMRAEWHGINGKLIIERRESLGQVPWTLIVVGVKLLAATVIVLAIVGLLKKTTAMENIARTLEAAGATPAEITEAMRVATTDDEKGALQSVTEGTVGLVKWVVLGTLGIMLLPQITARLR